MISAAFTVNSATNPAAHSVSYGSTVNLSLLSYTGVTSIVWRILSCSDVDEPIPTITTSGTPPGVNASFVMPADPGDDYGRTFLISCTVSTNVIGYNGGIQSVTEYGVVGVPNVRDIIPIAPGEENYRHGTHGYAPEINMALSSGSGEPGEQGPQGEPGDPLDPTIGDPAFTGNSTGTEIRRITLATGKHYVVAFHGLSYTSTLTNGFRSRAFDLSVCVSTLTGSAVLQSPVVGRSIIASGNGELEFEVSGLDIIVKVYGGTTVDTEYFGPLEIVREYDPSVQIDGWYPTDESDCMFCWDANVGITTVSTDVSAWLGQVGTVTATASSARPGFISSRASLNNQPAVWFDQASNEKLTVANLTHASSDYSFFCAIDQISLDNDGYIFDSVTGRLVLASDRNTTAIAFNDGSFKAGNTSAQTGAHSIGWILDGSTSDQATMRKNRSVIATGQSYTRVAIGGTTKLGSQNSGTTSGLFNGYIGIFFGFSSVDPARRFKAEKYMYERFGV